MVAKAKDMLSKDALELPVMPGSHLDTRNAALEAVKSICHVSTGGRDGAIRKTKASSSSN